MQHARELARVQTEAASAQADARELAQLRGELRSRNAEIAKLKRACMHTSAGDVDDADSGGGAGAGAGSGASTSGGGSASSGLAQLHTSHQALLQVKKEKADVGEQLADKDELCGQVVLSEDRKNDTIDRLKARLREAGVGEHEIAGLVSRR